jgi:hypothetical protein
VGAADIIVDYYHGTQVGLANFAGELGATYAIPIIYVPLLMITNVFAFYLLLRPKPRSTITASRPGGAAQPGPQPREMSNSAADPYPPA